MAVYSGDDFANNLKKLRMNKTEVNVSSIQILRIMLSGIFIMAGINHVLFPAQVAKKLMESSVYEKLLFFMNAELLVSATGIGLLAGGFFLLFNRYTRIAAILLLALLIPITISVQLQGWQTVGPLFKNVAIAGGLLFFIINKLDSSTMKNYEIKN